MSAVHERRDDIMEQVSIIAEKVSSLGLWPSRAAQESMESYRSPYYAVNGERFYYSTIVSPFGVSNAPQSYAAETVCPRNSDFVCSSSEDCPKGCSSCVNGKCKPNLSLINKKKNRFNRIFRR